MLESALWHELGFVDSYLSRPDRAEVLKRFETAISKSQSAWSKTYNVENDHRGAIEIWRQIFGDKFPSYG